MHCAVFSPNTHPCTSAGKGPIPSLEAAPSSTKTSCMLRAVSTMPHDAGAPKASNVVVYNRVCSKDATPVAAPAQSLCSLQQLQYAGAPAHPAGTDDEYRILPKTQRHHAMWMLPKTLGQHITAALFATAAAAECVARGVSACGFFNRMPGKWPQRPPMLGGSTGLAPHAPQTAPRKNRTRRLISPCTMSAVRDTPCPMLTHLGHSAGPSPTGQQHLDHLRMVVQRRHVQGTIVALLRGTATKETCKRAEDGMLRKWSVEASKGFLWHSNVMIASACTPVHIFL